MTEPVARRFPGEERHKAGDEDSEFWIRSESFGQDEQDSQDGQI
jgi:hypothetical protein